MKYFLVPVTWVVLILLTIFVGNHMCPCHNHEHAPNAYLGISFVISLLVDLAAFVAGCMWMCDEFGENW